MTVKRLPGLGRAPFRTGPEICPASTPRSRRICAAPEGAAVSSRPMARSSRWRGSLYHCRRRRRKPIGLLSPEKQKLSEKQTKVRNRLQFERSEVDCSVEEKSAHHLTLPRTCGYQQKYHHVCARQRIAHCPAMEKGTYSSQPQRTSAPAVLVVVDCATLSQGQGIAEAPGKGSTPGKSGAQCPYPGHKRTQATGFMAVTSLGAESQHMQV